MFLLGCKAPPQAPETLEELCEFLFAHMDDEPEEDEFLQEGLKNLYNWHQEEGNTAAAIEGYSVHSLTNASVSNLDDHDRSIREELIGVSSAYQFQYFLEELLDPNFISDWGQISDNYEDYERIWEEDPNCLYDQQCTTLNYQSNSSSVWAGIIQVSTTNIGELRWVMVDIEDAETQEIKSEWVLLQRVWLKEPVSPEPESWGIKVHQNFLFNATIPTPDGALRTSANWFDTEYGIMPVTEEWILNEMVDAMHGENEIIEDWLDENGTISRPPKQGCSVTGTLDFNTASLLLLLLGLLRRREQIG